MKFWAIEMGTNDAYEGNGVTVEMFEKNLQTIINTARAHGITPIIARLIAMNLGEAGRLLHQRYLAVIDKVVERNNLPVGPDFAGYFTAHPEELASDGIHPANPTGGQSMHRLWAEAVASFYSGKTSEQVIGVGPGTLAVPKKQNAQMVLPKVIVDGRTIMIARLSESVSVAVVDLTGHVVWNGRVGNSADGSPESMPRLNAVPAGNYIVKIRGATTSYKTRISIR